VPYFDGDGRRLITKYRTSLFGKDKMRYRKGDKAQVYGLFMRKLWEKDCLVLVEGESDCWTLWHHEIPAYGLPGNQALRPLQKEHLEGFGRLFISCEQDEGGGQAFVRNCVSVRRSPFLTVMVQWSPKGGRHHDPRQTARSAQRTTLATLDSTLEEQRANGSSVLRPPPHHTTQLLRLAA
jgi:hypothetical protein